MTAFVGRDVLLEFAIGAADAAPGGLSWLTLGMMRGKGMKTSWDTADTTADQSPSYTKTSLVTFKQVEFSGDGVSYTDTVYNQVTFKQQVISPGGVTAFQPMAWLRLTDPDGSFYQGPFIVSEWSDERQYADAATWSVKALSNGDVSFNGASDPVDPGSPGLLSFNGQSMTFNGQSLGVS